MALYKAIDNWLVRINSLKEFDIENNEISLSDAKNFLDLINFLFSDYELLYHGEIKILGQVHKRDGYSHDSLKRYLSIYQRKIKAHEAKNERKHMKLKWELIDTQWMPKGHLLDEGVHKLKSIINELKVKFTKKFTVEMKETEKNSPYVFSISDNKKTERLKRYEILDFEKQLTDHPWSSKRQMRKKQKTETVVSSSSKIVSSSSDIVPQSTRIDRIRRIVVEDSPQGTTSGNKRTSNISVQNRQIEDPKTSLKLSAEPIVHC